MRWNIFKQSAGNIPINLEVLPKPTFVNSKVFANANTFCKALEKKGWQRLGAGYYSTVYGKDGSDKVLKVGRQTNDGWIDYCKWAAENGFAGNLAPKVYSYKLIKGSERAFSVALMERMETVGSRVKEEADAKALQYLIRMNINYNNDLLKLALDAVSPKCLDFAKKMQERWGRGFDLHDGNYMIRKDGSLCFTDPLASEKHASIKRRLKEKDFEVRLAA